jgi:hypothetical protein
LSQNLTVSHSHSNSSFANAWFYAQHTGNRVANDRQERIKNKGHQCCARADPTDEWKWNQKTEESKTRNGLHYVCDSENWSAQGFIAREENARWDTNHDGDRDRHDHEHDMLSR